MLKAGAGTLTEADLPDHFAPALLAAPPAQLQLGLVGRWAADGPYTVQGFTRPPVAPQAVALLAGGDATPFALPLGVEATPPHRSTGFEIMAVPPPPSVAPRPFAPGAKPDRAGGLVDLGGRRLCLACRGAGSPTVVPESGLGDPAAPWFGVESAVAGFTRVCSRDRANTLGGARDPALTPRSGQELADDLHLLLQTTEQILAARQRGTTEPQP